MHAFVREERSPAPQFSSTQRGHNPQKLKHKMGKNSKKEKSSKHKKDKAGKKGKKRSKKEKKGEHRHRSSSSSDSSGTSGSDGERLTVNKQLQMGRAAARAVREILAYNHALRKELREVWGLPPPPPRAHRRRADPHPRRRCPACSWCASWTTATRWM